MWKKLSRPERDVLNGMRMFVCYNDCLLRFDGDKKHELMTQEDLANELGYKPATFKRIFYSLVDKGCVTTYKIGSMRPDEPKTTGIIVNPDIFMRGCNVNETVVGIFAKTKWREYLEETSQTVPHCDDLPIY